MISYMRNPSINKSVPGLLLFILILPGSPASVTVTSPAAFAAPTLPDSSRPSAEDSGAQRTMLVYPDRSQNSSSDDPTDPPETTETAAGLETSAMFTSPNGGGSPKFTVTTRIPDEKLRKEHDVFTYDDRSLRTWGLICALILCVIGILVEGVEERAAENDKSGDTMYQGSRLSDME
ncbi:unnamed protein product [Ranitomeya imitator]|uniref:FXYD domain-containing ion transport regulator n=1 Tax=Ranitomeya imitator TaxID=111125 RepID=A0ABN9LNT0_9NEOB|nr:unnamed protein product [Ranitomeya imitator]